MHTMHDSSRASSSGIPATKSAVWDLLHAGHITVSDGVCPASTPDCCPKKDPEKVWGNARNPLLAICSGVTSRNVKPEKLHSGYMALFTKLMPSIVSTVDCDIDYLIVVGFDLGDQFYDTPEGQEEVRLWFVENMAKPLADKGINVQVSRARETRTGCGKTSERTKRPARADTRSPFTSERAASLE